MLIGGTRVGDDTQRPDFQPACFPRRPTIARVAYCFVHTLGDRPGVALPSLPPEVRSNQAFLLSVLSRIRITIERHPAQHHVHSVRTEYEVQHDAFCGRRLASAVRRALCPSKTLPTLPLVHPNSRNQHAGTLAQFSQHHFWVRMERTWNWSCQSRRSALGIV